VETIDFDASVIPTYGYLSGLDLNDPWMIFTAQVDAAPGEFDLADNYDISDDDATAQLCELAAIQWHVYIDTDANDTQDQYDPYYNQELIVYLSGTDVFGNGVTWSALTENWEYFFGNLNPGTYETYYTTPWWYEAQSSVWWFIYEYDASSQIVWTTNAWSGSVNGAPSLVQVQAITVWAWLSQKHLADQQLLRREIL